MAKGYATHCTAAKSLMKRGFIKTEWCVPSYWIGPNNERAFIAFDNGRYHIR